ncbi:hypothetical protein HMN09_01112600 [Mycena chlorophos]|uniref:Uncharacterized protein n=1 Tax=Mycena chlorophos TaxID=658473 RepID=A0A8H6SCI3_MYCCL|nr:hypothetical protein HMN09_01112600 [Mycena chlorophos]
MRGNHTFLVRVSSPIRAVASAVLVLYLIYLSGYIFSEPELAPQRIYLDLEERVGEQLRFLRERQGQLERLKQGEAEDGVVVAGAQEPLRFLTMKADTVTETETRTKTQTHVEVQTVTRTVDAPRVTVTSEVVLKPKPKQLLRGLPTEAFKDNLLPDVRYITSWGGSGFTNDVIAIMNLIYLGMLTERVPVIPHIAPTHVATDIGGSAVGPGLEFGDAFDLPRYFEATKQPLLEWSQIKDKTSQTIDPLGCWNLWEPVSTSNKGPHWSATPHRLKLDISYNNAPTWIKRTPDAPEDLHTQFSALISLAFPTMRGRHISPAKSPLLEKHLPPDEHMLCFDNLYWACDLVGHEIEEDWSGAWRFVGQYLHWAPKVEGLADEYIRYAFGLSRRVVVPPFIALHVRRGDFKSLCDGAEPEECFAPITAYHKHVSDMKARLLETKGVTIKHVLLMSDEDDEEWWRKALTAYGPEGWTRASHVELETAAIHGRWYPILVDAAMQSHPSVAGLVGTVSSTVSIIAGKRIASWNDGAPMSLVSWGRWGKEKSA